jgi:hypothetical protein
MRTADMEEVSRRSREAQEEDMMLRDDHRVYDCV